MGRIVAVDYPAALSMDGAAGYVSIGNVTAADLTTQAMIAFWVCAPVPSGEDGIVSRYNSVSSQRAWLVSSDATNPALIGFNFQRTPAAYNGADYLISTSSPFDGRYHHVVCTFCGGKYARIYIDGRLDVETAVVPTAIGLSTSPLEIGRFNESNAQSLAGKVSDVQIYNQIAENEERVVNRMYREAFIPAGLTGRWKLTEGSGTTAYDISGNGNNGTLQGTAGWSTVTPGRGRTIAAPRLRASDSPTSLKFSGSGDYVNFGVQPSLALDTLSIAFYYKPTVAINGTIYSSNYSGAGGFEIRHYAPGQFLIVKQGGTVILNNTVKALPYNQFNHHIFTYDNVAGTLKHYLNGALFDSAVTATTFTHGDVRIGQKTGDLEGYLTQFKVFNRVITANDAKNLYAGNINPSGLVAEWNMQEGIGGTVQDTSGNGIHGTINTATWKQNIPSTDRCAAVSRYVKNSQASMTPPLTAATNTIDRWINGQAAGSTSISGYGWGIKSIVGTASAKIDGTLALTTAAGAEIDVANFVTGDLSRAIPVTGGITYKYSYKMKTVNNGGSATSGAYVQFKERDLTGTLLRTSLSTKVNVTSEWTTYTGFITTLSTAKYMTIHPTITGNDGAGTLAMDANFDDFIFEPVAFGFARATVGANLVDNGDFRIRPIKSVPQISGNNFIDGTATGSSTNPGLGGWKYVKSGTASAEFDNSDPNWPSLRCETQAAGSYVETRSNGIGTSYGTIGFIMIPGRRYRFSMWMKTEYISGDSGFGALASFLISNATGGAVYNTTIGTIKTTTDWTYYSTTITAPALSRYAHVEPKVYGHTGTATLIMKAWFADVSVREIIDV